MAEINTITISGNLTKDATTTVTQSGKYAIKISLAHNINKMVNGAWESTPMYFDVTKWEDNDRLLDTLTKGTKVVVVGKLEERSYTNRSGQECKSLSITATQIISAAAPSSRGANGGQQRQAQAEGWNDFRARKNAERTAPKVPAKPATTANDWASPPLPVAPAVASHEAFTDDIPF